LPQVLVASAENKIPLTLGKKFKDELYYLCENSSCQAPEKVLENVLMKLQH